MYVHHVPDVAAAVKTVVGSAFAAQMASIIAEVAAGPDPTSWITVGSNVSVVALLALVTRSFLSGSIVRVDVQKEAAVQAAAHAAILGEVARLRDTVAELRTDHAVTHAAVTRLEKRRQL